MTTMIAERIDDMERDNIFSGINAAISLLALFLNALVITIFMRQKLLLRSVSNRILLSQSIGDFLTGTVLALHVTLLETFQIYTTLRIASEVITTLLVNAAVLHMVGIAIDRYIGTFYALRYKDIMTKGRTRKLILVAWLLSTVFSSMQFLWLYQVMDGMTKAESDRISYIEAGYSITSIVLFMLFPMVVLGIVFLRMFFEIRRILRNTPCLENCSKNYFYEQFRICNLFMIMFFIFVFLSVPFYAIRLLLDLQHLRTILEINIEPLVHEIAYIMKNLSPVSNPLVYVIYNEFFRAAMCKEFSKLTAYLRLGHIWKRKLSKKNSKQSLMSRKQSTMPRIWLPLYDIPLQTFILTLSNSNSAETPVKV